MHTLSNDIQEGRMVRGKEVWLPGLAYPYFTTKGLPFWKRPFEKYWRPECECGRIFDNLEDFRAHYFYKAYYGED